MNGCFTSIRSKAFFLIELTEQFSSIPYLFCHLTKEIDDRGKRDNTVLY